MSCGLARERGLQTTKPLLNVYVYWPTCNVPAFTVPIPMIPYSCENEGPYGRIVVCLPEEQLGYVIIF